MTDTEITLRRVAILGSRGFPSTYGGYETLVRYLARAWTAQGLDVTVYCRQREPHSRRRWDEEGVTCRWTPGHDTKTMSTLSYGMTGILDASLRDFDAALVLNVANGFFLPALRASGTATAINTDGIEWERGKWGRAARSVFLAGAKATARFADVLIADSEAIGAVWQEKFGVPSTFIPYGAPVWEGLDHGRIDELGLEPGTYALVVARLIPENNVEITLDALERLGPDVPAVIVGSANYGAPIEERLRKLDDEGRVRWLGHVDDQELLNRLWAHCGVYVHGHSVGGTNPALLQAMGAGAPTLALDTKYNREVVVREDHLFSGDPDELAARMRVVLDDQALRASMAAHGRKTVAERYAWPDVTDRYLAALQHASDLRHGRVAPAASVPA